MGTGSFRCGRRGGSGRGARTMTARSTLGASVSCDAPAGRYDAPHARCPTAVAAAVARNTRRLRTDARLEPRPARLPQRGEQGHAGPRRGRPHQPQPGHDVQDRRDARGLAGGAGRAARGTGRAGGRAGRGRAAVGRAGRAASATCWWARTSGTTSSCGAGRWPPATGTRSEAHVEGTREADSTSSTGPSRSRSTASTTRSRPAARRCSTPTGHTPTATTAGARCEFVMVVLQPDADLDAWAAALESGAEP